MLLALNSLIALSQAYDKHFSSDFLLKQATKLSTATASVKIEHGDACLKNVHNLFFFFNPYNLKRQSALFSHKIHLTPFDDKRIAFWMAKAVYFEIHVKIGPFYGFWTTHLYV